MNLNEEFAMLKQSSAFDLAMFEAMLDDTDSAQHVHQQNQDSVCVICNQLVCESNQQWI